MPIAFNIKNEMRPINSSLKQFQKLMLKIVKISLIQFIPLSKNQTMLLHKSKESIY